MLSLSALPIVPLLSFLASLFSQLLVSWRKRLEFLFPRLICRFIFYDLTFFSGYTIWTWANIYSLSCGPLLPAHLSSLVFPLLQFDPHPGAWFSICHDRDSHHDYHGPVGQWLVWRFTLFVFLCLIFTFPLQVKRIKGGVLCLCYLLLMWSPFLADGGILIFELFNVYSAMLSLLVLALAEVVLVCCCYGMQNWIDNLLVGSDKPLLFCLQPVIV